MSLNTLTECSFSLPSQVGMFSKAAVTLQEDVLTKPSVFGFETDVVVVTEVNAEHLPGVW